jgi:chromosome transmission fidelity protein 1
MCASNGNESAELGSTELRSCRNDRRQRGRRRLAMIAEGPDFHGDVIVFDEAHNVVDACRGALSAELTRCEMETAIKAVAEYSRLYETRLLTSNKQKLRELSFLLERLHSFTGGMPRPSGEQSPEAIALLQTAPKSFSSHSVDGGTGAAAADDVLLTIADFCFSANVDNINVLGLLNFMETFELARKMTGIIAAMDAPRGGAAFHAHAASSSGGTSTTTATTTTVPAHCVHKVQAFLAAFGACTSEYSRMIVKHDGSLKPVVCDLSRSSTAFADARSIVFAGGTLQPLALSVYPMLTPGLKARTVLHTFGHVVPSEALLVLPVAAGPGQIVIELTHANRNSQHGSADAAGPWEAQLRDAALAVVNLACVIPMGLIVCFPSYRMEALFFAAAEKFGLLPRMAQAKKIFREERTSSGAGAAGVLGADSPFSPSGGESLVAAYAAHISACGRAHREAQDKTALGPGMGGGLLSCVMGGKLSEGISFNDDLARGVIVIGMPFPNPHDAELNTTLHFCAATQEQSSGAQSSAPVDHVLTDAARVRELYTALCMRQVNQAIGRCIRHAADYAVVVLLDRRYTMPATQQGLPRWMHPSIARDIDGKFGAAFRAVRGFFDAKRTM